MTAPTNSTPTGNSIEENDIADHRDQIEALLTLLESSAPAILRALDQAIADATALKSAIAALDTPP
jgi:hypothetical protein